MNYEDKIIPLILTNLTRYLELETSLGLEKSGQVTAAVQDADNIDTVGGTPVKNEIITDGKATQARRKAFSREAHTRSGGQEGKSLNNGVNQPVGGLDAPAFRHVKPYCVQVRAGLICDAIMGHTSMRMDDRRGVGGRVA
jgi:hypothetical protein